MQKNIEQQAAQIFLKAAAYIRKYGWQKEGMGEDGKSRCSMGALESVGPPRSEWNSDLSEIMYVVLYKELDGLSLTQFNSRFESGEKVARLYEKAASRLRSARGEASHG